jgi:hypothetical protein
LGAYVLATRAVRAMQHAWQACRVHPTSYGALP